MSHFPPHAWRSVYGGYQPPDYLDPMLVGVPGFIDGPAMFHHPFMSGGGGCPPPFYGGGPPPGPPGPPPPGDHDGPGFGMPPPHHGFPPPHGPPPPFGGGFAAPWMDPGFGGPGPFPGGGGGGAPGGGHGGGGPGWHWGEDSDGEDDAAKPKVVPRRAGARAGVGMIYNPKQTRLHIFRKTDIAPWKDGAKRGVVVPAKKMGGFNIWDADVGWTVKQLLEYLGKGEDAWAVSEVTEAGNGRWYKGSTIGYKDERADETLSKQGWTEKRGRGLGQAPVWLVLHKVE